MKAVINVLYNGKELKNLEKASVADEEKLVTQVMAQNIETALEPLKAEIEKEGGEVTIDLTGPNRFEIETKDISDKLKEKVLRALTPSR